MRSECPVGGNEGRALSMTMRRYACYRRVLCFGASGPAAPLTQAHSASVERQMTPTVAVVARRAARALRLRRRPSVRPRSSRGLPARVRAARARHSACACSNRARPRDSELEPFHTPSYVDFVRGALASRQGFLDGGDTPALRGVFEAAAGVVGATPDRRPSAIMDGARRRAFVPIAGLHHAARDSRRRVLRVQRLRRGDRDAARRTA